MFTCRVDGMMVVFVLNSVVLVFLYLKLDVFGSAWYRFGLFCCNVAVVWVLGYLWVCVSIVLCAYWWFAGHCYFGCVCWVGSCLLLD